MFQTENLAKLLSNHANLEFLSFVPIIIVFIWERNIYIAQNIVLLQLTIFWIFKILKQYRSLKHSTKERFGVPQKIINSLIVEANSDGDTLPLYFPTITFITNRRGRGGIFYGRS